MRIKLDSTVFPFMPGSNWVDLWNIFYLTEDNEIKYGWNSFNTLRCYERNNIEEPYIPNPTKTAEIFPLLLKVLEEEAAKLKNVDFGTESDKIAKIKYVREKYDLGLKEAKELVEEGALPPAIKCWKIPSDIKLESNIPNTKNSPLVYVENRGIFPLFNILQNKHLEYILDWQPELSTKELTATSYYLYTDGDIMGVAPKAEYFCSKYTSNFKILEENINPSNNQLIGMYKSKEEAESHYTAFMFGVELASKAVREQVIKTAQEYTIRL